MDIISIKWRISSAKYSFNNGILNSVSFSSDFFIIYFILLTDNLGLYCRLTLNYTNPTKSYEEVNVGVIDQPVL